MTHPGTVFRTLHVAGHPFIMANVWDKGSAKMLQSMGAKALATSSAAHAFTLGRVDGGTLTCDEALAHASDILSVATVPVQGDFENGFGDSPDDCAQTVRMAAEIGLAGICIEDTILPGDAPYDHDLAIERIRAAASAARALPNDFVLTARADGIMIGSYDTDAAIKRLQGFSAAGADCLYAPMPPDMAALARICATVDKPVNALVAGDFAGKSLDDFAKAGAARLSLGSALARVTHRAIYDAASEMFNGQFSVLKDNGIGSDTIDQMMT
ncbi:isocitrate lyase/phosphoenolpyruvate mutase family protein [Loktanella sp. D2R18]|uniref:isocitrate lyase/PEP mutase family protein n=1 Tax=Rhodobacterales TaxID=204455 RepID=UPI000DE87D3F|nr:MULTISPECIES: isocitrate lyase/phosphoenolpyruvate mutase family protein [Rhodobacterales]MDO6590672.1 isocitrate lyase/phosphoenolpyruvate mutase family protein [Yoonia sp. 1_MG-2023]RBW44703.1 isocitrate lyase/phosphoenolpyruvate mutase family protein [Loktanella sp. D2R18]